MEHLHNRLCRARRKSRIVSGEYLCHVHRAHPVHVFLGTDHLPYGLFIQILWERTQQQDPMDVRVFIFSSECLFKIILAYVFRKLNYFTGDPRKLHPLLGSPLISKVIRARPHPYDDKAWLNPILLKRRYFTDQFLFHSLCHIRASHNYTHTLSRSFLYLFGGISADSCKYLFTDSFFLPPPFFYHIVRLLIQFFCSCAILHKLRVDEDIHRSPF